MKKRLDEIAVLSQMQQDRYMNITGRYGSYANIFKEKYKYNVTFKKGFFRTKKRKYNETQQIKVNQNETCYRALLLGKEEGGTGWAEELIDAANAVLTDTNQVIVIHHAYSFHHEDGKKNI
jgi:hypothetical protein